MGHTWSVAKEYRLLLLSLLLILPSNSIRIIIASLGTQELELYMSDNVYVEGGNLVIRTHYDPTYYNAESDNTHYMYTSGWLDTQVRV